MRWRSIGALLTEAPRAASREGLLADGQKHGRCEARRADGTLAVRADYVRGVRHGCWTRMHANGRPAVQVTYVDGVPHGPLLAWYPNGRLALHAGVTRGRLDGSLTAFRPDGRRVEVTYGADGTALRRHG